MKLWTIAIGLAVNFCIYYTAVHFFGRWAILLVLCAVLWNVLWKEWYTH